MAVILDLDGTLVDSVFHHVLAWDATLTAGGYEVPLWRVHAAIGMGSKRLVPWLLGRHVPEVGDLGDDHDRRFLEMAGDLRPTVGALDLLDDLEHREVEYRIATSAGDAVHDALVAALGRKDLPGVDADDVGAPKPAPDLLVQACRDLGVKPTDAVLVGDSPWDAEAAGRLGMRMIAVRCGGFGDDRLLHAGAEDVVDDPRALVGRL